MTRRQAELLRFIETFTRSNGVGPSYAEIADATGLKSRGNVHRMLVALEERGRIQRLPNHARAIRVVYPIVNVTVNGRAMKMRLVPFDDVLKEGK
jgi:repressor LexA